MVSNEVWLDSQATVSLIPEQDIYLGTFASGAIASASNGQRTIPLGTDFTAHFSLVADLYRGCMLDIYASAGNTLGSPTITTAGTQIEADESIIGNAAITGVSGLTSTGAEIVLTLSAESSTVTFVAESGSNYNSGFLTINLASPSGTNGVTGLDVLFNARSATVATSTGEDSVEVLIQNSATGEEIAEAVRIALAGKDVTVTRDGAILTITNNTGGYVGAAHITETTTTATTETMGSVLGGIITAVTVTDAGSSVSGNGNLTITSNGGTDGVLALAVNNTVAGTLHDRTIIQSNTDDDLVVADTLSAAFLANPENYYGIINHYGAPVPAPEGAASQPRLLSDNWLGLASSITVPSTSVEPKQINVGLGGTRNFTYQFKGAETTSEFSMTAFANSFPWLYYTLGSKTVTGSDETGSQTPGDNGFTLGSLTGFAHRDNQIHRVIAGKVCPPFNGTAAATKLDDAIDHITYAISEKDSSDLPSFAIEYTLKKPGFESTVATDADKEDVYTKIYPGCTVSNLQLTAAAGQEVECQVSAMPKTTFIAPTGYGTLNGVTDVANFVNFGTRAGEDTSDASGMEERMRPFFFSDGTIELFGQEFLKIENMTLTIDNTLQQKRFIGRYDKRSQENFAGQRTYNLTFTGLVTDATIFDHFRREHAFSLQGVSGAEVKLEFVKTITGSNEEKLTLTFEDYHVTQADFPLTNDNGPLVVNWTIVPLALKSCELKTYWAIQG